MAENVKKGKKARLTDKQREQVRVVARDLAEGKIQPDKIVSILKGHGIDQKECEHQAMLMLETKEDTFKRLAIKRVPKAVKAISAVRVLLASANYKHTDEQAKKVVNTIGIAMDALVAAANGQNTVADQFSL